MFGNNGQYRGRCFFGLGQNPEEGVLTIQRNATEKIIAAEAKSLKARSMAVENYDQQLAIGKEFITWYSEWQKKLTDAYLIGFLNSRAAEIHGIQSGKIKGWEDVIKKIPPEQPSGLIQWLAEMLGMTQRTARNILYGGLAIAGVYLTVKVIPPLGSEWKARRKVAPATR